VSYALDVPPRARREAFDTIVVEPTGDAPQNVIGHLIVDGFPATDGELQRRVALRDRGQAVERVGP
jgi:hypothetical protein